MARVNEFTPLLVDDGQFSPPTRRRSVWQYVLAGALGLGVLSLFQQRNSVPIDVTDVIVSFDETSTSDADELAFRSTMETFKDPTVDPCVDFYQYACGGWLKAHEIPADRPGIDSSFYVVSESNKDTIRKIFDQNPPQIGQLYHSCLNTQEVDIDAVNFIAKLIENVHQVNSTLELMALAGEIDQSLGISTFFSVSVGADPEDPTINVLQLAQGGLTLPSREYYLEESKVDAFAALYVDYVTKLFAVGGLDSHNVSEYAEAVLETETALAKISLSNAALRNPWTTNTAYPFAEIATRYPFLMAYLNGIYKLEPFPMLHAIIATPSFFEAQNELLSDETLLPQLKNYVSFHLIDSFGAVLGEYFRRASHEFHGKIQGAGDLLPRDQFCVRLTTNFLGDELGKYYMQEVFGPDAKAAAQALVTEIEESLKALLLTESWLDKVTYDAAVDKLNNVKNYIGGPDDVPPLPFELQADAFFNNVKSLMQLSAADTIQAVGKPVDEQAWDMFPSTVNAYYDPSANKMVFPAAILQPPFYSSEHFPAAANFARIGMVMGHELSHGFDDQGRNYDGNGALRSWWTPSVSAQFAEKAQCLAAQYSSFPVVSNEDGHVLGTVNGNLTLGENIADNGGIHLAYEAYQLWKSTFVSPPIVPPHETPTPPVEPPLLQATDTGLPPPVLPIPEAETPEPQTEPSGDIPVPTSPHPDETSPAQELPIPEQTPVPTETHPATGAPVMAPPAPTIPTPPTVPDTPPVVPDVPDTPAPPNVPDIPPPVPTPPPAIMPPPQPKPSDATPDETSKHKHKEKEEPGDKEHEKHKQHGSASGKDKKHDNSESKKDDEKNHKPSEKEGKSEDKRKHGHETHGKEDEKSKKTHDKGGEENTKEERHRHENSENKDDDLKKHKKDDAKNKEDKSEAHEKTHHHEDEKDGDPDDKYHYEGDRDKHGHSEHESKHERREGHHRRDEEKEDSHHREKRHHDRKGNDGRDEEGGCRCGNHHHWDEDDWESDRRKHHKRHEEHRGKHHHHHHRWDEDYGDDDYDGYRESRHHKKHHPHHEEEREERWHECDCERHHHKHKHHWDHDWERLERKYPFSHGNLRIHTMVQKLARAMVLPSDSVADDQLFFTAFAQNWCEKSTPGYAELLRTIDPHSPGKWRVNGPLMNYNKFAEAFSCPVGTPMNPEKKCVIW
ncbi:hypothetical protein PPTG_13691 [Phytophthora nicotianae INRA-310]|uniref:Peptidase M13 C-terminal domain-containing protein n=1 Tax=Phytophthora nicotianae (strain INRA-310) TaxID=761204 RepID=W2Q257_PHYN3|nr:hypothetical protein PPTG_13691 [Phytophthora nicotianae INRA-310]ETN06340.1 hypothetical protein PPTG_13691 [Phytophthora nicotianae INRA-310]